MNFLNFVLIFWDFWNFWPFLKKKFDFWGSLWIFGFFGISCIFFWIFFRFFSYFWIFLFFLKFLDFFGYFFVFLRFLAMLLRLLLKVTKVTTGHQKLPKMGQNSIISFYFCPKGKKALAEGRSPLQELEVGPRSGPYLLVIIQFTFLKFIVSIL